MAEWVDWMALYDLEAKERESEQRKAKRGRAVKGETSLVEARKR